MADPSSRGVLSGVISKTSCDSEASIMRRSWHTTGCFWREGNTEVLCDTFGLISYFEN